MTTTTTTTTTNTNTNTNNNNTSGSKQKQQAGSSSNDTAANASISSKPAEAATSRHHISWHVAIIAEFVHNPVAQAFILWRIDFGFMAVWYECMCSWRSWRVQPLSV